MFEFFKKKESKKLKIDKKIKLGAVKQVGQPNVCQVQTTNSQTVSSCMINSTDKGENY